MSWNDTYIFWNVETSNNSFLDEVSMGNFYMFITQKLIDNNTTLTTFEALGNLKSQTRKLSHTLINSVAIQPYAIQQPLVPASCKTLQQFCGFSKFLPLCF
jgi:hypothetical protein